MSSDISVDLLIYTVGYETRASYAVKNILSKEHLALRHEQTDMFSYENNCSYSESEGHSMIRAHIDSEEEIYRKMSEILKVLERKSDRANVIGLDISSMQKEMISCVISQLFKLSEKFEILLKIIYTTGQYKPPPEHSGVYTDFHPIKGLEGWTVYPENPLSVVLGLGYEPDQAVGVLEYFDPSGSWAFVPLGADDRFLADVKQANVSLWDFHLLKKESFLNYPVDQPGLLYSEIRGLVDVLRRKSRVIIIPAGPKMFSAIAILVALELGDEVSLWRASSHDHIEITDTLPTDKLVQFDYKFTVHQREI